ncbi:MAG: hypothetical protein M1117_05215 [Candidatus Thermoplasmatota archaeon]|nr:hypothetical protein [Candidatus Thermoplasmatota archaeon]
MPLSADERLAQRYQMAVIPEHWGGTFPAHVPSQFRRNESVFIIRIRCVAPAEPDEFSLAPLPDSVCKISVLSVDKEEERCPFTILFPHEKHRGERREKDKRSRGFEFVNVYQH